jgi:hypothetical protein
VGIRGRSPQLSGPLRLLKVESGLQSYSGEDQQSGRMWWARLEARALVGTMPMSTVAGLTPAAK